MTAIINVDVFVNGCCPQLNWDLHATSSWPGPTGLFASFGLRQSGDPSRLAASPGGTGHLSGRKAGITRGKLHIDRS